MYWMSQHHPPEEDGEIAAARIRDEEICDADIRLEQRGQVSLLLLLHAAGRTKEPQ